MVSKITYELLKNSDVFKNIPILTLDERWYHLINEKNKTDEIAYWEKQVNELLKKQGRINNDIKDIKKLKKQLINDVVENMEDDDSSRQKQKRMSQNQRLIQESNDKIASLEDELLEVPRELARANEKLLTETLKACYDRMNANTEDIEVLDKWINATRVKLKKNILIKQDKDKLTVSLGNMRTTVGVKDVMLILGDAPKSKNTRTVSGIKSRAEREVKRELDIRGLSADEALIEVDRFLDAAVLAGSETVTIIHGKGTGVLREAVRRHLKSAKNVKAQRPGVFGEGEDGVTVVTLK